MYTIKVSYQTGNSFNNSDEVDYIDMSWKDKDVAKKNLKAIRDHYNMVTNFSFNHRMKVDLLESTEKQRQEFWFPHKWVWVDKKNRCLVQEEYAQKYPDKVERTIDTFHVENNIILLDDNGKKTPLRCFWIGHFEKLYTVEIVINENDGMKYEFF